MKYALLYAKEMADIQFDVFNCLNIMDNSTFLKDMKFGAGDGLINYYMFNYQMKKVFIPNNQVGAILL